MTRFWPFFIMEVGLEPPKLGVWSESEERELENSFDELEEDEDVYDIVGFG